MPPRSTIQRLPEDLRRELDRRLIANGFGGHSELADWLAEQGWEISRSAVQRHSAPLERSIEQIRRATQAAESLVDASGDDGGAVSDATLRLVQQRMFDMLRASEDDDPKALAAVARSVADTSRAAAAIRQVRRKLRREIAAEAESVARGAGISADTAADLRRALAEAG